MRSKIDFRHALVECSKYWQHSVATQTLAVRAAIRLAGRSDATYSILLGHAFGLLVCLARHHVFSALPHANSRLFTVLIMSKVAAALHFLKERCFHHTRRSPFSSWPYLRFAGRWDSQMQSALCLSHVPWATLVLQH